MLNLNRKCDQANEIGVYVRHPQHKEPIALVLEKVSGDLSIYTMTPACAFKLAHRLIAHAEIAMAFRKDGDNDPFWNGAAALMACALGSERE